MDSLLTYFIYAVVFVGVVLAIEGLWLFLRSVTGESRAVARRLARIRREATPESTDASASNPLDAWLDQRFPWLGRTLVAARISVGSQAVIGLGLGVTGLVLALFLFVGVPGPLAAVAATIVGFGAPLLIVAMLARRRLKRFVNQMPQAVDLIARSLQAGHPVTAALAVVGKQMPDPIGPEFAVVIEEMTYGLERDAALSALVRRFPSPELRMFVASLEVTRESGGNLAEVFLKLAEAIRAKAQLRLKVEALSAEGRLSFWVVSCLPVVVGGAIVLVQPEYYGAVLQDPLFWPMMAAAPVLLAIGAVVIWRMVNFKI